MKIVIDDLSGRDIAAFLEEHLQEMRAISPPESVHALDLDGLRQPGVTFWSARDGDTLVGCGALKELGAGHAEIKSMRTAPSRRGQGVAATLLGHLIDEARKRGYCRLSLETGSFEFFAGARSLYRKFGFEGCDPFGTYTNDPNSVYLTKAL
jgi:putative acetyltransferase